MKIYLSLTCCFICCFTQCAAQKDITQLLIECQQQLDSSQYQTALNLAIEAESLQNEQEDFQLSDAYCLVGLAHLKINPTEAVPYFDKMQSIPEPSEIKSQALRRYFTAQVYHAFGYPDTAIIFYEKTIEFYKQVSGKLHPNVAGALTNIGVLESAQRNNTRAIELLNSARSIYEAQYGTDHPSIARVYHNLGLCMQRQGRFLESKVNLEKAMAIRSRKLDPLHREMVITYLQYGLALEGLGRFDQALDNFEQARIDGEKIIGGEQVVSYAQTNIGLVYSRMGYPDKSKAEFEEILKEESKIKDEGTRKQEMATTFFNIATGWKDESRFDSAMKYYCLALEYSTKDHENRPFFLEGIGKAWEGLGRLDSAEFYFKAALNLWIAPQSGQQRLAAQSCFNLANIRMEQKKFEDALNWNRNGQQYMGFEKGMDFNMVSNLHNLCGLLSQEAQILLKQSSKANLKVAKESCEQAMKAIQIALQESEDGESREAINASEGSSIYEQNIILNNAFYDETQDKKYWQQSFLSSEQAKAREMIQMLNDRDSEKTNCYPESIVEKASEYRIKIERLKVVLDDSLPEKSRDSLQAALKRVKKQHHALQKQMKTQYPDCWNRLHTFVPLDVATIQKNVLSPDQVMIEYFVGKDKIFFFVINQQGLFVEQREKDPDFEYLINTLDENMEKNNNPGDIIQITNASVKLYQILIAPVRQYLEGYSRLVIIPDGLLAKVPFNILLKNEVSPGIWSQYKKNYLMHDFAISGEYSAAILHYLKQRKPQTKPSKYILVGAPFASVLGNLVGPSVEDVALPALSNSGLEIDSALSFWPGDRMIHHTIDEFWQLAPQYKIIHIPTHCKAVFKSRASSWLAFKHPSNPSNYAKLYVNDFYSRQLNSELTIFSACESGRGLLRTREGVLAFGRAALIAGSASAVVTLWSVKTKRSLEVTTDFHRALKSGIPKDVALQSAMKQYLERSTTGYSGAPHPYYWANWVIYGDMKPIR